ncbi:LuxR C-terminal-related transcriptional regulator [Runella sp.]|uniref:LuxR C-terminal-related transcriptional regulator n=1 Tax=Runella sp. TaxID=1960881 RepID=UPI003D0B8118
MSTLISCPFNFNNFKKIWNSGGLNEEKDVVENLVKTNPLLHETLLMQGNALAVLDIKTMQYSIILGDVEKVCGWSADYFYKVGVEGYTAQFLPEDAAGLGEISKQINAYVPALTSPQLKKFRVIYDYRMQGKDGEITRVCQESIALKTDKEGHILYFLAFVSDITHFKREGKQHFHLSGGDTAQLGVIDHAAGTCSQLPMLGKREREIAKLLGQGLVSDRIAERLAISVNTVNTHRQNMLRKLELTDTTELLNFIKIYRLI